MALMLFATCLYRLLELHLAVALASLIGSHLFRFAVRRSLGLLFGSKELRARVFVKRYAAEDSVVVLKNKNHLENKAFRGRDRQTGPSCRFPFPGHRRNCPSAELKAER